MHTEKSVRKYIHKKHIYHTRPMRYGENGNSACFRVILTPRVIISPQCAFVNMVFEFFSQIFGFVLNSTYSTNFQGKNCLKFHLYKTLSRMYNGYSNIVNPKKRQSYDEFCRGINALLMGFLQGCKSPLFLF